MESSSRFCALIFPPSVDVEMGHKYLVMAEQEPSPLTYVPETVLKKRKDNEQAINRRKEQAEARKLRSKENRKLQFKRAEQFIKEYRLQWLSRSIVLWAVEGAAVGIFPPSRMPSCLGPIAGKEFAERNEESRLLKADLAEGFVALKPSFSHVAFIFCHRQ
ncbi:60S ribosomal protein L7-2 [Nymphaea thermarum]|nr:60S ribosomal protein L7-2 [Nymphaea thermarum]